MPPFSREHLQACAVEAARGKRRRPQVAWFLFRLETETRRLAEALTADTWRPSPFDVILIRDPKPRAIARAPFEDRVVQSVVARALEPVFLPATLHGDMACRTGGGTGHAVLLAREYLRRYRFAVHLDVRAYFPSVQPDLALRLVERRVRHDGLLRVLGRILDAGRGIVDRPGVRAWVGLPPGDPPPGIGLPVGAHTSQFLATHVYLLALDHHIKRVLRVPGYVRFVDDLLLFGDRRADLRAWREAIGDWLGLERGLRLKHPDAPVVSSQGHLDALGFRMRRDGVTPLPRAERRFRHWLRRAVWDDDLSVDTLRGTVASSTFHLMER